ncbi:hypothetical protein DRN93_06360, partial [archaeon]
MAKVTVKVNDVEVVAYRVRVEKEEKRAIDIARFTTRRNANVDEGDEVKIYVDGSTLLFGGYVSRIDAKLTHKEVEVFSYEKVLEEKIVSLKTYSSQSPEAISQDLIESYTDFTWDSTWSSGVTLSYYEAKGLLSQNIRMLSRIAGADYWVEPDKKFKFEPAINRDLGKT